MRSMLFFFATTILSLFRRVDAFGMRPLAASRGSLTSTKMASTQLPAEAKRYYVRPDRILDVLTSSPQIIFRLGSGLLVDGYRCEQSLNRVQPS